MTVDFQNKPRTSHDAQLSKFFFFVIISTKKKLRELPFLRRRRRKTGSSLPLYFSTYWFAMTASFQDKSSTPNDAESDKFFFFSKKSIIRGKKFECVSDFQQAGVQ